MMKMITAFFALILISLVASTSSAKTLVFSEECSAPLNYSTDCSKNDGTKWCLRDNHWHQALGHGSCNMAANVTVADGLCVITLKEETVNCNGTQKKWTGGEMNTLRRWGYTHGYLEARIKLPQGKALWSAFWTYPNNWVGAPGPEHDIFETPLGTNPSYQTYLWWDGGGQQYQETPEIPDYTGWHVWAMNWQPGLVAYTLDGVETFRYEGENVPATDTLMSIFLSLEAGGNWFGEFPDASSNLPQSMYIDYIRVYDQSSMQGGGGVVPSPPGQLKILK